MMNEGMKSKASTEIMDEDDLYAAEIYGNNTPQKAPVSEPDPYAKLEPSASKHNAYFDEEGRLTVRNPSAYWLEELELTREIGGTEYTVTGSYDGTETLDRKLNRIFSYQAENNKTDIEEDAE